MEESIGKSEPWIMYQTGSYFLKQSLLVSLSLGIQTANHDSRLSFQERTHFTYNKSLSSCEINLILAKMETVQNGQKLSPRQLLTVKGNFRKQGTCKKCKFWLDESTDF